MRKRELHCSFCGKSEHEVKSLIAGPKVFICDECVSVCINVLGQDRDWCDTEIVKLKRLRKQATQVRSNQGKPEPEQPDRGGGWLNRVLR